MRSVLLCRMFAWAVVGTTFAFLANTYLIYWRGWPEIGQLPTMLGLSGEETPSGEGPSALLAIVQVLLYLAAIALPIFFVLRTPERALRTDAAAMNGIVNYLVRAGFWAVFLIGLADLLISFLRIEGYLASLVGNQLTTELGNSQFRVPYVHLPLMALSLVIAVFSRALAFPWLALLVVLSELAIVITRFIFSYEQAFMADLVRFWYAALFLFASAYTLFTDDHVRVDVLYTRFDRRRKGRVNAIGAIVLGMVFCWVILILGMSTKSSIITAPLLTLEVTQSGFGMYIKYLMAGFLGFFAVTMMIQFCSSFLEGVADQRGEKGSRIRDDDAPHLEPSAG